MKIDRNVGSLHLFLSLCSTVLWTGYIRKVGTTISKLDTDQLQPKHSLLCFPTRIKIVSIGGCIHNSKVEHKSAGLRGFTFLFLGDLGFSARGISLHQSDSVNLDDLH